MVALWGSFLAIGGVLMFETRGAFLRTPMGMVAVVSLVGYTVFRLVKRTKVDAPAEEMPIANRILRIAKEHKGRVTVGEVLAETSISVEDATKSLDDLTHAGACQLVVSDKGMQVYYFPEFEDESSKERDELVRKAQQQSQKQ